MHCAVQTLWTLHYNSPIEWSLPVDLVYARNAARRKIEDRSSALPTTPATWYNNSTTLVFCCSAGIMWMVLKGVWMEMFGQGEKHTELGVAYFECEPSGRTHCQLTNHLWFIFFVCALWDSTMPSLWPAYTTNAAPFNSAEHRKCTSESWGGQKPFHQCEWYEVRLTFRCLFFFLHCVSYPNGFEKRTVRRCHCQYTKWLSTKQKGHLLKATYSHRDNCPQASQSNPSPQ